MRMTLADCVALAEFAHRNQYDKAGEPYIKHPKRVLANVQAQGAQPYVQMAAVLHDVTEDTPFTPQMLLDLGVPEAAVNLVELLDRDYSAKRHKDLITHCFRLKNRQSEWIGGMEDAWKYPAPEFYYHEIRKSPGALMVKLADIMDNLQPWRLLYLPEKDQARLQKKYRDAIERLTR